MESILERFERCKNLAPYTTMKVGGPANYFFEALTPEELFEAVKEIKRLNIPFVILGKGSNVVFSDEGFKGLVILNKMTKYEFQGERIFAESGVLLAKLVREAAEKSLSGLEEAGGIPGTIGGAVFGNAGGKEWSISKVIEKVKFLDVSTLEIFEKRREEIDFGYRESEFKKNGNIILEVFLKLQRGEKEEILRRIRKRFKERKEKYPLEYPSAGSIFKNPKGYFAGELIEKTGLKGYRRGGAKISNKHANFIINVGDAKARDVYELVEFIKEKVKKKFGIRLEEEIIFLGFNKLKNENYLLRQKSEINP